MKKQFNTNNRQYTLHARRTKGCISLVLSLSWEMTELWIGLLFRNITLDWDKHEIND